MIVRLHFFQWRCHPHIYPTVHIQLTNVAPATIAPMINATVKHNRNSIPGGPPKNGRGLILVDFQDFALSTIIFYHLAG